MVDVRDEDLKRLAGRVGKLATARGWQGERDAIEADLRALSGAQQAGDDWTCEECGHMECMCERDGA